MGAVDKEPTFTRTEDDKIFVKGFLIQDREEKDDRPKFINDRPARTSKINTWKAKKPEEIKVEQDGHLFVCNFDRIFGQKDLRK